MAFVDLKIISTHSLDEKLSLTIAENIVGDRIFVEFSTNCGRLRLERSFPATVFGNQGAEKFQASIRSTADLYAYFGMKAA